MNCRNNVDIETTISVLVEEGLKYYENIHDTKLKYKFRKRSVIFLYDTYNFTFGHVNFDTFTISVKFFYRLKIH
jgi:hypothetical protein